MLDARQSVLIDPATPRSIASQLTGRPDLWRPQVEFRDPRHYVRLLHGEGWEAWLLTWLPGQETGLHDHGGSAGAFTVVEGVLEESIPAPRRGRDGLTV